MIILTQFLRSAKSVENTFAITGVGFGLLDSNEFDKGCLRN